MTTTTSPRRDRDRFPRRAIAIDLLVDILSAGPKPAADCKAELRSFGMSARSISRAAVDLGLRVFRRPGHGREWWWALVPTEEEARRYPWIDREPSRRMRRRLRANRTVGM
jgi:hypothetical protein